MMITISMSIGYNKKDTDENHNDNAAIHLNKQYDNNAVTTVFTSNRGDNADTDGNTKRNNTGNNINEANNNCPYHYLHFPDSHIRV